MSIHRCATRGLLATVNADDPALIDLDLGAEYALVAGTFGWSWQDMVQISLDGVEACWLGDDGNTSLAQHITAEAVRLALHNDL
jgi:adenosine deaminase